MLDTTVTMTGNLVADPTLTITAAGVPLARFRVAATPRWFDREAGAWRDGDSTFLTVQCWRQLAEHVADSLHRGDRVLVVGRLRQRSYERDGDRRTVYEIEADSVGADLGRAPVRVLRAARTAAGAPAQEGEQGPAANGDLVASAAGDPVQLAQTQ
jgi:single-strand DNA-binding protein